MRAVVLLGRPTDPEFDLLQRMLRLANIPFVRIGAGGDLLLTPSGELLVDGLPLQPTVCWTRRPLGVVRTPSAAIDRDSWTRVAAHLEAVSPIAVPGGFAGGPAGGASGSRLGLLEQLRSADQLGVRTPRTVVTTDKTEAAGRLAGDRLVVKVLDVHFVETEPGKFYGYFPEVVPRSDLAADTACAAPVVVQEYVKHHSEQRIYYLRGELVSFEVVKPTPAAPWLDPDAVQIRSVPVDPEAAEMVRTLSTAWGVRFGAFDVLLTTEGPVFLELNHDGDWRWFEAKVGSRIVSTTAARMVRDLHLSIGGTLVDTGFDLLSFVAT